MPPLSLARLVARQHEFELSPIKGIELEASTIPGVVSLAQGIPHIPVFPQLHEYVSEQIRAGKCDRYSLTNGLPELREEIALALKEQEDLSFDPASEIIVTCGSIEGITASLLALTEPGDEVILPSPTYASYSNCIRLAKCTPRWVELDEDAHFDFHIERLEAAIGPRTRILLFCLPNNPTSTMYSREKLEVVLELAQKHNLYLLVDEVYKDFYYEEGLSHFSPLQLSGAKERTIRICSFSKAYSLTGWRVGFLCANPELTTNILRFHDAMVTCAPVASQYAAIAALRYGESFLKDSIHEYRRRRDYALTRMSALSRFFDYQVPRAGYFLFPRLKDSVAHAQDSRHFCHKLLHEAKVATVYGAAFGPSGESHVRLNFGRSIEELEIAFDRIQSFLQDSKPPRQSVTVLHARHDNHQTHYVAKNKTLPRLSMTHCATRILQFLSRLTISKNRHHTVVFLGQRSRTLIKRLCFQQVNAQFHARLGVLSYNTPIGVSLAVLGESAAKTKLQWAALVLRSTFRTLFAQEPRMLLFLEFSADSPDELAELLGSSPIHSLIITPSFPVGTDLSAQEIRATIEEAIAIATPTHTVVCSEGLSEKIYEDCTFQVRFSEYSPSESELGLAIARTFRQYLEAELKDFRR